MLQIVAPPQKTGQKYRYDMLMWDYYNNANIKNILCMLSSFAIKNSCELKFENPIINVYFVSIHAKSGTCKRLNNYYCLNDM